MASKLSYPVLLFFASLILLAMRYLCVSSCRGACCFSPALASRCTQNPLFFVSTIPTSEPRNIFRWRPSFAVRSKTDWYLSWPVVGWPVQQPVPSTPFPFRSRADNYDRLSGAAGWARDSLEAHASDPREWTYSLQQLEEGKTHEDLWNAAQLQLVSSLLSGLLRVASVETLFSASFLPIIHTHAKMHPWVLV